MSYCRFEIFLFSTQRLSLISSISIPPNYFKKLSCIYTKRRHGIRNEQAYLRFHGRLFCSIRTHTKTWVCLGFVSTAWEHRALFFLDHSEIFQERRSKELIKSGILYSLNAEPIDFVDSTCKSEIAKNTKNVATPECGIHRVREPLEFNTTEEVNFNRNYDDYEWEFINVL